MRRRGYLLAIITSKVPKYQRQSKTKNIQIVERLRQLDWVVIMLQAPCTGFRSISNSKTLWMRSASSGNDGAINYLMNTITKRGHGESLLLFWPPVVINLYQLLRLLRTKWRIFLSQNNNPFSVKKYYFSFDPTFTKTASTNNLKVFDNEWQPVLAVSAVTSAEMLRTLTVDAPVDTNSAIISFDRVNQFPIAASACKSGATKLKKMIAETDELIVCPGVYDGLSARIALRVGFSALYMVSFSVRLQVYLAMYAHNDDDRQVLEQRHLV